MPNSIPWAVESFAYFAAPSMSSMSFVQLRRAVSRIRRVAAGSGARRRSDSMESCTVAAGPRRSWRRMSANRSLSPVASSSRRAYSQVSRSARLRSEMSRMTPMKARGPPPAPVTRELVSQIGKTWPALCRTSSSPCHRPVRWMAGRISRVAKVGSAFISFTCRPRSSSGVQP